MVSCATSSHSENEQCSKSTVQCNTNHQFEYVFTCVIILHDFTLFRVHARCHGRRRVALSTNDVARRLLSAMPIVISKTFSVI